ncbi:MAG TPA: type II toxin-antitoxin system RelE/ParE family toxin [Candidatus Wirthbacteria bacterium]|nr:type II toxin-antitoxin system RelE/ParE family toxin [Candidatus Wirthbacteria bacterium]
MTTIVISPRAEKQIRKLPGHILNKFARAMDQLEHFPLTNLQQVRELKGDKLGYFRFRIHPYRILFSISEESIYIHAVLHRKDVYKK